MHVFAIRPGGDFPFLLKGFSFFFDTLIHQLTHHWNHIIYWLSSIQYWIQKSVLCLIATHGWAKSVPVIEITWGWVNYDTICIVGRTIPLKHHYLLATGFFTLWFKLSNLIISINDELDIPVLLQEVWETRADCTLQEWTNSARAHWLFTKNSQTKKKE